MHTIISVPTVFTCKTPDKGWLNLAQVRQLEYDNSTMSDRDVVIVTWQNGDRQTFTGENATAILQVWEYAQNRCHCTTDKL